MPLAPVPRTPALGTALGTALAIGGDGAAQLQGTVRPGATEGAAHLYY